MGYIVLAQQLDTMRALTNDEQLHSVDLVWLPGYIQFKVWDLAGNCTTYNINEDGQLL